MHENTSIFESLNETCNKDSNMNLLFIFILGGRNNNVVKMMSILQENLILNQIAL